MSELNGNLCQECQEGYLEPRTGSGRTFEVRRGLRLELPSDLEIPTCDNPVCGQMAFDDDLLAYVTRSLRPEVVRRQISHVTQLVDIIQKQTGCSLKDLELACNVTPTYLSHVRRGSKDASDVLIGLLEALAIYPEEYSRRLARTSCFDTDSVYFALSSRSKVAVYSKLKSAAAAAHFLSKEINWVHIFRRFADGLEEEKRAIASTRREVPTTNELTVDAATPTYADVIDFAPHLNRHGKGGGGWTKAYEVADPARNKVAQA